MPCFVSFTAPVAELAHGENCVLNHSLTHSPSLFDFSSLRVVSSTFSALCVYSKFQHHPHPLGYLCAKFRVFCSLHCWASPRRKIMYSITHPAYLMRQEPKQLDFEIASNTSHCFPSSLVFLLHPSTLCSVFFSDKPDYTMYVFQQLFFHFSHCCIYSHHTTRLFAGTQNFTFLSWPITLNLYSTHKLICQVSLTPVNAVSTSVCHSDAQYMQHKYHTAHFLAFSSTRLHQHHGDVMVRVSNLRLWNHGFNSYPFQYHVTTQD